MLKFQIRDKKMQPTFEGSGDSEMKSQESIDEKKVIDLERYRNLVRTFIDLVRRNFDLSLNLTDSLIYMKNKRKKKPVEMIELLFVCIRGDIKRHYFGQKKLSC